MIGVAIAAGLAAESKDASADDKVADFGAALTVRPSFDINIAGSIAGASAGDVFAPGPGIELEAGLIVTRGITLYGGWERVGWGVGDQSPYIKYAQVSSHGDFFGGGIKLTGCMSERTKVSFAFDAALGYTALTSKAQDKSGNTAEVTFPGFAVRPGLGLCVRPVSWLRIDPTANLTVQFLSGNSGSVTIHGDEQSTKANGSGVRLALSPGLAITGELPF